MSQFGTPGGVRFSEKANRRRGRSEIEGEGQDGKGVRYNDCRKNLLEKVSGVI